LSASAHVPLISFRLAAQAMNSVETPDILTGLPGSTVLVASVIASEQAKQGYTRELSRIRHARR